MKRIALLLVVGLVGCTDSPLPTITNINTNTNILNGGTGGLDDPNAVAGQCLPSEETPIRVDLNVPVTAPVGGTADIDSTPKSGSGKRSDGCNVLQGIYWTASPATTCSVPQPTQFNGVMKCLAAGPCQLTATVPAKGASGTATVSCQ